MDLRLEKAADGLQFPEGPLPPPDGLAMGPDGCVWVGNNGGLDIHLQDNGRWHAGFANLPGLQVLDSPAVEAGESLLARVQDMEFCRELGETCDFPADDKA